MNVNECRVRFDPKGVNEPARSGDLCYGDRPFFFDEISE